VVGVKEGIKGESGRGGAKVKKRNDEEERKMKEGAKKKKEAGKKGSHATAFPSR